MSKDEIERKYVVSLFKDFGFDNKKKYWVCMKDGDYYCDGWTLREIEGKLKSSK